MPGTITKNIPMFQTGIGQNHNGIVNGSDEQMDVSMKERHNNLDVKMDDGENTINDEDDFNTGGDYDVDDDDDNDGFGFALNNNGNDESDEQGSLNLMVNYHPI